MTSKDQSIRKTTSVYFVVILSSNSLFFWILGITYIDSSAQKDPKEAAAHLVRDQLAPEMEEQMKQVKEILQNDQFLNSSRMDFEVEWFYR